MQKVLASMNDPDVGTRQIGEIITSDQALTTCVLKHVNSSYFGLRVKISNIYNAVTMLGFSSIRQICLSVSICGKFKKLQNSKAFSAASFWKHSLAAAILARDTSKKGVEVEPDVAYTAGLIHDIGKLLLLEHHEERFLQALSKAKSESLPMHETEKSVFEFNHADVGNWLFSKWKLSPELKRSAKIHHSADLINMTPVSPEALAGVVFFANQLAHRFGYGGSGGTEPVLDEEGFVRFFGIGTEEMGIDATRLDDEIRTSLDALGIQETEGTPV
jgi:putative nucleotidyltransferase with HDIG domain